MTVVLDRLARAKLAERRGDPKDRRSVLVAATASAKRRVQEIWKPIEQEGTAILSAYSQADVAIIEDFLDRARAVQVKHAERIRTFHKGQAGKGAFAKQVKPVRQRA
jgi:DNA-binding MarR family transcriptional regulator